MQVDYFVESLDASDDLLMTLALEPFALLSFGACAPKGSEGEEGANAQDCRGGNAPERQARGYEPLRPIGHGPDRDADCNVEGVKGPEVFHRSANIPGMGAYETTP